MRIILRLLSQNLGTILYNLSSHNCQTLTILIFLCFIVKNWQYFQFSYYLIKDLCSKFCYGLKTFRCSHGPHPRPLPKGLSLSPSLSPLSLPSHRPLNRHRGEDGGSQWGERERERRKGDNFLGSLSVFRFFSFWIFLIYFGFITFSHLLGKGTIKP